MTSGTLRNTPRRKRLSVRSRKKTLDHVQPGGAGRGEVHVKAAVPAEPPLHALVGVGRVVVADQVHVQVRRDLFVDEIEEPDPFVMAVTGQAGADDVAGQRAERGEQGVVPFRL